MFILRENTNGPFDLLDQNSNVTERQHILVRHEAIHNKHLTENKRRNTQNDKVLPEKQQHALILNDKQQLAGCTEQLVMTIDMGWGRRRGYVVHAGALLERLIFHLIII